MMASVAVGQINIVGNALQQKCNDRRTGAIETCYKRSGRRVLTHTTRSQVRRRKLHQGEISRGSFPRGSQPLSEV